MFGTARGLAPTSHSWVLDWNAPAIDFYRSIGAVPMDEWTVYRVTGDALQGLAASADEREGSD